METRIIKAVFGASKSIVAPKRFKNDWGQVLELVGITLPQMFTAHFANSRTGTAKKRIGQNNQVDVPDEFFTSGADIYCWVMVHDTVSDGRTMYTVRIPIEDRGTATDEEPTPVQQDVIEQAIAALNAAVEQTAQDVEAADASAQSASDSADRAEAARDTAEGYVGTVQGYTQQAQTSATNASSSATASANSASQAQQIKTDVEGMVDEAQSAAGASAQSALESAQSASQASTSASVATQDASASAEFALQAKASAQTASTKATEASNSASTASQKALESSQSAFDANGYATAAGQAKTAAETAQGLAEQAQSDAESAKDDAESARDEAQQIVSGISGKVEQIDQNTADIASLETDRYKAYATDTATGAVASFPDGADNIPMKDVTVQIEPVQDLHGYDNPWPAGGGVNKFKYNTSAGTRIINGVTWTLYEDGSIQVSGTASGESTFGYAHAERDEDDDFYFSGNYKFYAFHANISPADFQGGVKIGSNWYSVYANGYSTALNDADGKIVDAWFQVRTNKTVNATIRPMIYPESEPTPTAWSPCENICPISGWTGMQLSVNGTVIPISWQTEAGTVYGGTLDVTTGELVVDRANIASYNGETLPSTWISDRDAYSAGTTPTTGAQVVYELAEPIHYTLDATEIRSLLGQNNVFADTGDSTAEYRADTKLYISKKIAEAISALS